MDPNATSNPDPNHNTSSNQHKRQHSPTPSSITDDELLDTLFAPWLTPTSEPAFKLPPTPTPTPTISRLPESDSRKRRRMSGSSAKDAGGTDSRMTGNSWFPDIPRILPHEKVGLRQNFGGGWKSW